jgi:hypothetical protein
VAAIVEYFRLTTSGSQVMMGVIDRANAELTAAVEKKLNSFRAEVAATSPSILESLLAEKVLRALLDMAHYTYLSQANADGRPAWRAYLERRLAEANAKHRRASRLFDWERARSAARRKKTQKTTSIEVESDEAAYTT